MNENGNWPSTLPSGDGLALADAATLRNGTDIGAYPDVAVSSIDRLPGYLSTGHLLAPFNSAMDRSSRMGCALLSLRSP